MRVVTADSEVLDVLFVVLLQRPRLVHGVHDADPGGLEELALEADVVDLGLLVLVAAEVAREVNGEVVDAREIDDSEKKGLIIA